MRDMRSGPVALAGSGGDLAGSVRSFGRMSHRTFGPASALLDFLAVAFAGYFAGVAYHFASGKALPEAGALWGVGVAAGLIHVLVGQGFGQYKVSRLIAGAGRVQGVLVSWLTAFLVLAVVLFLLKLGEQQSRGAIVTLGLIAPALLVAVRLSVNRAIVARLSDGVVAGYEGVVIGTAQELDRVMPRQLLATHGTRLVGRFQLSDSESAETSDGDRSVLQQAIEFARVNEVERIVLALPWRDTERLGEISAQLQVLPVSVMLLPDRVAQSIRSASLLSDGSNLVVEISRAPLTRVEQAMKRMLDLAVVGALGVVVLPVGALIAAVIKLTSTGPVLFRQDRVGFNGKPFSIYNFRTMTVMENGPDVRQACDGDVRVTRFGRFLRRSSLDELPQLINVLRGEMAFVGPRPHAIAHHNEYEKAIAKYAHRHHVKPGIMGWAQVNGLRGATPRLEMMARRVDADLWYIANWSFWLDLQILAKTVVEVVRPRNAY